jgi:hypothetical protein
MQGAMGPVVWLRTRSLYDCLLARAGWDAPVIVNSKVVDEIIFWKENTANKDNSTLYTASNSL